MITIHKYQLDVLKKVQKIEMPSGAKILALHTQLIQTQTSEKFVPMMWSMVETENPKEYRNFEIFETGSAFISDVQKRIHYIGTFQIDNYVGHVFEVKK